MNTNSFYFDRTINKHKSINHQLSLLELALEMEKKIKEDELKEMFSQRVIIVNKRFGKAEAIRRCKCPF